MIAGPEHAPLGRPLPHSDHRCDGNGGLRHHCQRFVAKHFVRHFYEYTRNAGIGRIGFFPAVLGPLEKIQQNNRRAYGGSAQVCETCSIGDMVYIACRLQPSRNR